MRKTSILVAIALLAVAAPANARSARYAGKTKAGDAIAFKLSGGAITNLRTNTPTTCVPTDGTPRAGTDTFEPAGRFALGTTSKLQTPEPVETAMHYGDVTKNFHVTAKRGKGGRVSGQLHQNFSFETLGYDSWGDMHLVGWVCQGDVAFSVRPRR